MVAALLANTGIAITKFLAFALTGVSSMLAEAIHSVADACNQVLLLIGGKRSRREATPEHPFGFGRERYIYSFIVSIVLFSVGGLFALYEAYHKFHEIQTGHAEISEGWVNYVPLVVLAVAMVLETWSFRTAIIETNKVRGDASYFRVRPPGQAARAAGDPARGPRGPARPRLRVRRGEPDAHHRQPYWDVAGTTMIGLLLVVVAVTLAIETKSLLLGESASPEAERRIRTALEGTSGFERIIHLKTLHLGPEELLVAAKVSVPEGASAADVAGAIDEAERAIRAAEPTAQVIFLEPDIYRADHQPDARPEPPAPAGH